MVDNPAFVRALGDSFVGAPWLNSRYVAERPTIKWNSNGDLTAGHASLSIIFDVSFHQVNQTAQGQLTFHSVVNEWEQSSMVPSNIRPRSICILLLVV